MALPPGFRFHPTDEELVAFYLKRKVAGRTFEFNIITEIDLYKQEPWDLPEKSFLPGSDMEWYFFSPRDKKYPNGLRTNRATEAGYWKATGKDRNVKKMGRTVGMKKTLVFYQGRAPHGERTDWVMHEYRLDEEECEKVHASQDLFVLCRVFKKSGVGPRSGEDRGPQTYVDDDIDKEPSGSFAEALKKALGPENVSAPAIEPAPVETPKVAPMESSPISAPSLSADDYAPSGEVGDAIDMPETDDYILDEPTFTESEEDGPFWDCFPSITAGLDLPTAADEQFSSSELFETLRADREADTPSGMMWNCDPSSTVQQDESNGGGGYLDMLQLELLETDDVLPPLVEELESNCPPKGSDGSGVAPTIGENLNQQHRSRGPARARSRAARQQPTSEEAQQRARSSNDGLYRHEETPLARMSNTNFRGSEVPSLAREDRTSLNVTSPAPAVSTPRNSDIGQLPSSSNPASSASAVGFGNSGIPPSEDHLFSFQDSFFDFAVDDELINATSEHDVNGFNEFVADQRNSEVDIPPQPQKSVKHPKSGIPEGPPGISPPQGALSKETRPVSKPLAGLMRLLGSLPALPASAAECPPDMKHVQTNGAVSSTYSSIHVSAVTVTCSSSADGAQEVQTAVTDCRLQGDAQGLYRQVVSGSWQTVPVEKGVNQQGSKGQKPLCANCDTAAASGVVQRRVARGSNSGFVFVFVLGAMSALCWYLLLRGMWRLASHVFTSVF